MEGGFKIQWGGGASFLSGAEGAPWRGISFDGGVFEKIVGYCDDLKFLGGILKKYNVEIPDVN